MGNVSGHNYILNSISVNKQGVLFAGGDNGMFRFCDWKTGYCFQEERTVVQPGSLDSEAGIFASTFDLTGTRLITCEADKTIKGRKRRTQVRKPILLIWKSGNWSGERGDVSFSVFVRIMSNNRVDLLRFERNGYWNE